MRGQAFLFAGVLMAAAVAAAPANADPYRTYGQGGYSQTDPWCAQQKQNRMLAGAAIGGIAGAVIGKNLAARKNNTEGTVLGGATGAAAGALIGRATACNNVTQGRNANGYVQPSADPYYNQGGYQTGYGNDNLYGASSNQVGYGAPARQDCRWGTNITRDPDGREMRESVYMCRGNDGVWRRSN
ncbi:MAG: YMGG-like glycine zipper-containing protein [Caulobacterales bacterium]